MSSDESSKKGNVAIIVGIMIFLILFFFVVRFIMQHVLKGGLF